MNKEELIKLGLTELQIEGVLKTHKETISGQFITKHRFDEVNNELKIAKETLNERDTQINTLKKFEGDNKALKEQLETLETDNKKRDTELKSQILQERKKNAIKLALLEDTNGKPHDTEMVLGLFNSDSVMIDEKTGQIISGFKEQCENIRKEKAFLFNATTPTETPGKTLGGQGWKPAGQTPPDSTKGADGIDKGTAYGKSLAQIKLGMLGIKTNDTSNK